VREVFNKSVAGILVVMSALLVILFAVVVCDFFVSAFVLTRVDRSGLIYPPNSRIRVENSEFQCAYQFNKWGFRGDEQTLEYPGYKKVLLLGDSFTFAATVELAESWPRLVENGLSEKGYKTKLFNLGKGGATTIHYEATAQRAVPLIRPDLIVICVLQGDDLAHLVLLKRQSVAATEQTKNRVKNMFPGLVRLMHVNLDPEEPVVATADETTRRARENAVRLLGEFDTVQRRRFEALCESTRMAFHTGAVNPALVALGIRHSDYFLLGMLDDAQPENRSAVDSMADHLASIRKIGARYGAHACVICVPAGPYVNSQALDSRKRLGFSVDDEMLASDAPDAAIKLASMKAGLRFYSVTAQFRAQRGNSGLFSPLDGHYTRAGNALFADSVLPAFERELMSLGAQRGRK
jgi:hypothetical protein